MSTWAHWVRILGVALAASLAFASGAWPEVVFQVDSTLDLIDDDASDGVCHTANNSCTLRAAVMQANLSTGAGATILLPAGLYYLTRPATGADGPESGDLNLTTDADPDHPAISIVGAGPSSTIIDANQQNRVFKVERHRNATLSDLTVRNGYTSLAGGGGGIWNDGYLALNRCTVSGNSVGDGANGGGIYNQRELRLEDSTVRNNSARLRGGGIYSALFASLNRSTIIDNVAFDEGGGIASVAILESSASTIALNTSHTDGGGIYSYVLGLTLTNTTVSGNNADGSGGGLYVGNISSRDANVYNSTIAFNGADADADPDGGAGGGVFVVNASRFHMRNSLLVGNTLVNSPIYDDCSGVVNSYGRNLFWEPGDGCTIVVQTGSAGTLNSLGDFGPIQFNGGPTPTLALLSGSNAIDGGDPDLGCIDPNSQPFATDQRGAPRAVGLRCDLGAFEYGALPAGTLFSDGFELGNLWAWGGG